MRIWGIILGALAVLGTVWGLLRARPVPNGDEHRQRIDAQTKLHRTETALEFEHLEIEICNKSSDDVKELNKEVQNGCNPIDLSGALDRALRGEP